jgi:cell division septation protein DedD
MQNEKIRAAVDPFDAPDAPESTMGRPLKVPTEDQRRTVTMMASFGIPQEDIGRHVHMSPKTLRKHCHKELKHSAYDANNTVLASLFTMATTRHNVAAAIFWAKCRCAFRPGGAPWETAVGALPKPHQKDPATASNEAAPTKVSGLTNMIVYDNSGEPNADY